MYIVVFVTVSGKAEAKAIADSLIKKKLVACVNIIDKINSFFRWQGKIDNSHEVLLVAKSRKNKFNKIIQAVKSKHSYQVPEIIAMPLIAGYEPYLRWIDESLK